MDINFIAYQPDIYNIFLKDYSSTNRNDIPEQIYAMSLDIVSNKIPNGRISQPIDLLSYLLSTSRKDEILYHITSQDLGLGENQPIPDGIYQFTYTINNSFVKSHKFLIYLQINNLVENLLQQVGYNVKIGEFDINYVGDYSKYDIEKVRLMVALLDELRTYSMIADEAKVNSSLEKLQRLATLIESEII